MGEGKSGRGCAKFGDVVNRVYYIRQARDQNDGIADIFLCKMELSIVE